MSNYIVEDEINDKNYVTHVPILKKSSNGLTKYVVGLIALFFIVITIVIITRNNTLSGYAKLEHEMLIKAQEYVNNSIDFSKETYIDTSKLHINVPNNCNILSGVLYKDGEFKPYLMCSDYESNIIDNNDDISLVGRKVLLLTKGSEYYELGFNGPYDIQISGSVNTDVEGVYNVYYISSNTNSFVIRKIIVVDNPLAENFIPVIDLKEGQVELKLGEEYNDDVIAIDKIDGNITKNIIKVNNINNSLAGEYKNIYYVSDSLGYTKMLMQKVVILNNSKTNLILSYDDDKMVNTDVTVNVKVVGDRFSYLLLPNGEQTKEKEINYDIKENGEYEFVAVNEDGSKISKVVKISNIDKSIPQGTCSIIAYSNKTVFNVNITSFNYIVGYNYHINNKDSGYITKSNYTANEAYSGSLYVKVKDYIGNESIIDCAVGETKSSLEPNGYQKMISSSKRIREPIASMLARKGYTINDLNKCIYNRVKENGPYTRYGVVAAAYGLIDCSNSMIGAVVSYDHVGGRADIGDNDYCRFNSDICGKLGVNSRWGTLKNNTCDTSNNNQCWYGLNCATFVRWSLCNGGMNLCKGGSSGAYSMTDKANFPGADIINIWGREVKYLAGNDLSKYNPEQLIRMIKPGDVMAHYRPNDADSNASQHAYVVVGVTSDGIITANNGHYMSKIKYSKMLDGEYSYRILYLDNYYKDVKNRNNLYN